MQMDHPRFNSEILLLSSGNKYKKDAVTDLSCQIIRQKSTIILSVM